MDSTNLRRRARRVTVAIVIASLGAGLSAACEDAELTLPEMAKNQIAPQFQIVSAGNVTQIAASDLSVGVAEDFESLSGNFQRLLRIRGAWMAERFHGQLLTFNGSFDVLSDAASSPLTLQPNPFGNLGWIQFFQFGRVVFGTGAGTVRGSGAMAVWFDTDQAEFGFTGVGAGNGTIVLHFFRRDGSLIDVVSTSSGLNTNFFGFRRSGGTTDIAGVSIHHNDPSGMGFDAFRYNPSDGSGDGKAAPMANAGNDIASRCAPAVTLDGSRSHDPDGSLVSYAWLDRLGNIRRATGISPTLQLENGVHEFLLLVTDNDHLTDVDIVRVETLSDIAPPSITLSVSPEEVWPPNGRYVDVSVTLDTFDDCTPTSALLVSATFASDEPDDDPTGGDGGATGDIRVTRANGTVTLSTNADPVVVFDPLADRLQLRAERAATGPGRSYRMEVLVIDKAGNRATARAAVRVPLRPVVN